MKRAVLAATLASAIAPAGAMGAPVEITAFSVSPSCTRPGSTVTANVTVRNTGLLFQRTYAQTRTTYFGWTVATSQVYGPYDVPPLIPASTSMQADVPWYAPWGSYTVTLGIGPSASDTMSWSTRTAPLTVAPPPAC
jgi:hypothetical protein